MAWNFARQKDLNNTGVTDVWSPQDLPEIWVKNATTYAATVKPAIASAVDPTATATATAAPAATPTAVAAAYAVPSASATSTPLPAWIANISDSVLRADFANFSRNGALTQSEVTTALVDLAGELASTNQTLSSAELANLKTIASNVTSMGGSMYLNYIVNAFVNGNVANAYWTGGAATSVALGNLSIGFTVTKLDELIGKWFQGSDLPQDVVRMAGSNAFSVSYSAVAAPLYGATGPQAADVNQGYLGDCYLMSSLAEVAGQDPSRIASMITDNSNGTYGVRFYVDGVAQYETVNDQLANGGKLFNRGSDIWASLVEKAFAQAQASGVLTGGDDCYTNSYSNMGSGGAPEYALEEITGASKITDYAADGSEWYKLGLDQSLNFTDFSPDVSSASLTSTLASDLLLGNDVILTSYTNATDSSGKLTLVDDHCMSIYGYDTTTGLFEVRNPWGVEKGQSWDTTFEISLNTLLADGDLITTDNVGSAAVIAGASVAAAAGLQASSQVKSFSVSDSTTHIASSLASLAADTKLNSVTINGTSGVDKVSLAGLKVAATVDLDGNSDSASVTGFFSKSAGAGTAKALSFGSSGYDILALGAGADTVDYALGAASGVLSVTNFSAAHDLLSIKLGGATLEQTLVANGDWLSASSDLTHGVFLANIKTLQSVTVSGGVATVA